MPTETPLSFHRPSNEPSGGVIVVQEAFGVNEHIEDIGKRFATAGYLAVVPHLFHRTGDPAFGYDDITPVIPHMQALAADEVLTDIDAAIAALEQEEIGARQIGIVGFCMGGTVALVTAAHRQIGAAVTFYGGGVAEGRFGFRPLIDEAPGLLAPWLGLFGDLDRGIPVEDVERLRVAAASSTQPTEVVRYPQAGHGFHCDRRSDHHPDSAADAWRRTLDWFATHLGG